MSVLRIDLKGFDGLDRRRRKGIEMGSILLGSCFRKARRETCDFPPRTKMATPLLAGLSVAAAAMGGRYALQLWQTFRSSPPRLRQFYQGGFLPEMTRREAAQILGLREGAPQQKVREAHRKIMVANHPDAGGSDYLAAKINEAKDKLLKKSSGSASPF